MLLIAVAAILWGAMGTAVQFVFACDAGFTPLSLVSFRQLAAGLLFVLIGTACSRQRMMRVFAARRNLIDVFINGVLIFGAHYTFFKAIFYSNAGTGAILLTLVPLLSGIWLTLTRHRPIEPVEILCFVLASAGVALIVTDGNFATLKFSPLAIVWGLLSACFAAAYCIQPLSVIARIGVTPVVGWGFLFGGLFSCLFCHPWKVHVAWTAEVACGFAFIALIGTVIAFWVYLMGLRWVSPVIAGLLTCLEPLSAFAFSVMLLSDVIGTMQAMGIALVLSNVCLLTLSRRHVRHTEETDGN